VKPVTLEVRDEAAAKGTETEQKPRETHKICQITPSKSLSLNQALTDIEKPRSDPSVAFPLSKSFV
jgi:hypothetical protein